MRTPPGRDNRECHCNRREGNSIPTDRQQVLTGETVAHETKGPSPPRGVPPSVRERGVRCRPFDLCAPDSTTAVSPSWDRPSRSRHLATPIARHGRGRTACTGLGATRASPRSTPERDYQRQAVRRLHRVPDRLTGSNTLGYGHPSLRARQGRLSPPAHGEVFDGKRGANRLPGLGCGHKNVRAHHFPDCEPG